MMNKMHCSSNSKSLWNDPASRSRRAFSTPQPHHLGKPSERRQDRISTVLCSSRGMDTKEIFHIIMRKHSESAWAKAPVKASTGKAVQQDNGSQIKKKRSPYVFPSSSLSGGRHISIARFLFFLFWRLCG